MPDPYERMIEKVRALPRRPGVYLFLGPKEKVLYVGKAKDLHSRVAQYYQSGARIDARKSAMVAEARDLSTIVTGSEFEALALEANLIKQHRPRYNVVLRDDKNYPYLKLTMNERWPRLDVVRRISRDGAMYFGPYVPSGAMWETLSFIRRNFQLRPCNYRLDRPMRPCIQHQMGRCPAPCAALVEEAAYRKVAEEVGLFLKGRRTELVDELRERMGMMSEGQRYEEAASLRDRIRAIEQAWASQKVVSPELGDMDVIGVHVEVREDGGGDAVAVALFIRNGTMIGSRDFILRDMAGVPMDEILHGFIVNFYSGGVSAPPELVLPAEPDDAEALAGWLSEGSGNHKTEFRIPRRGKRKELLEMAAENARLALESRRSHGVDKVIEELRARLALDRLPRSIGAFDISNLTGTDPVGGFVWWEEGEFIKERYRHLRIKDVEGIDDYAMMRETVRRVLGDMEQRPDLIIIDGGKGHLGAALEALAGFESRPPMVSVAKKPDRAFTEAEAEPVPIDGREGSSLLLRKIRDEVHRFAVGYHTRLRGKRLLESPLESIQGVGRARRLALLRHFKSLDAIRESTPEEITAAVPGIKHELAEAILRALNGESVE